MRTEKEIEDELIRMNKVVWELASCLTPTYKLTKGFFGDFSKLINNMFTCNIQTTYIIIDALERELEEARK